MSKNNHDIRANTLSRVDHLEKIVEILADGIEKMAKGNKEVDDALLRHLETVNREVDSIAAQVNDLENRLAAHQMDTLPARIKRWWRR